MAPAIIAVAGFVTANAAVISLAISVAAVGYSLYAAKKANRGSASTQTQRKQILRSSSAPKPWLYGENVSSGVLIFAEEEPGDQDEGEELHLVITHSGSPIHDVTDIYVNDEISSTVSDSFRFVNYPQGRTTVDQFLLDNTVAWEEDMIGQDFAWGRFTLDFDPESFPSGVPNITARKFGRRVFDPRTNATAYSDNPALCILDYMRNHPSLQYENDELILETFINAANICDELVDIFDAADNIMGQEKRYTLSAEFDINEDAADVIDRMLAACGGEPIKVGGRFGIHVGAYYGPATLSLNQDDIIGAISIQPEADRAESFNVVRGIYNSKENRFQETDYPEVRFDEWVTEDGEEIVESLDLRFINSPSQCQRVAALQAARTRFGMVIEIPCNLRGVNYPPGCQFNLTLETIGFTNVEFKVVSWRFDMEEGVTLICRRESADYYDNQNGHAIVLPPLLNIPTGGVAAPSNPTYAVRLVGEVIQGVISWTNSSFKIATTEVIIRDSNSVIIQSVSVPFPGTNADINGKLSGNYTAELYAVALTGSRSTMATVSFTVAAPAIPDSVAVTPSNWNVQLVPAYGSGTIPINTLFEFYYLEDSASFLLDPPTFDSTDRDQAALIFTGSTFNHGGRTPDRWHHYWVRAVNAYGSSGFFYVQTGTTRNQDLVTTVVERLEAIEIVSSNFVQGSSGYRLEADGDVEFNDGNFRGHLAALTLTLGPDAKIDYGDIDNPPEIRNGVRTFSQDNPPTMNLETGDLWIDTSDSKSLHRWDGSVWVDSRDGGISTALQDAANAQSTADGKINSFYQDEEPAANVSSEGDIWFDTNDGKKQYVYQGTTWIIAQDTAIGDAIDAAQNAQTTADGKVTTFFQDDAPAQADSADGDLWIDTDDNNRMYRNNGSAWISVSNTGLSNLYPDQTNLTIQSSNYDQGVAGWAIDNDGNAEFNNGVFRGTLFAQNIVGDIVSGVTKVANPQVIANPANFTPNFQTSNLFTTVQVLTARPWVRTLIISVGLQHEELSGATGSSGTSRMYVNETQGDVDYFSRSYAHRPKPDNTSSDYIYYAETSISIPIPANTTGIFEVYLQAARTAGGGSHNFNATILAPSTNNNFTALLISNGSDLV